MDRTTSQLIEASLDLAWTQWTSLGVRGVQDPPRTAVDPESLLVFTAGLRDIDARLYQEACDWAVRYGRRFISISRLRNLASRFTAETRASFATMAATINAHGRTRWPTNAAPERFKVTGKSQLDDLRTPGCSLLKMRCIFGTSARAEVLLAMLTSSAPNAWTSTAAFTELGYGKRNLAITLDDLVLGGLVATRRVGNANVYRLADGPTLRKTLAPLPDRDARWHLVLPLLDAELRLGARIRGKAPVVQSVDAAAFVRDHAAALSALEREAPRPRDEASYWTDLVAYTIEAFARP